MFDTILSVIIDSTWMERLVVFATLVFCVGLFQLLDRSSARKETRISSLVNQAHKNVNGSTEPLQSSGNLRRADVNAGKKSALMPKAEKLTNRIRRAGYQFSNNVYFLVALAIGIGAGGGLWLAGMPALAAILGGLAGAFLLPHLFLSNRISAREERFLQNLPEGIDIVVRGLKAGLPVSESLAAVGGEAAEPVGGIFREIVDLVKIGHPIEVAISKASQSMPLQELHFLGITLAIQKETGGNLTETLQNLSDILRKRRQMKLKVRAMSSEARTSAYIIGSLPFAVSAAIYFVNHDYVMTLFTDPRGLIMVACGLVSIAFGAMVMMKLVKFDI